MTSCAGKHKLVSLLLIILTTSFFSVTAQPSNPPDPYGSYNVSPSMAVIVVALIATLFFMAFFSIYIRNCYNRTPDASLVPGAARTNRSHRLARGIEASVIETFPTFVYSDVKGLKIGKGALECAVCLCEFEDDETLRLIPKCDHVFHPECIDMWLGSHVTCPVCRADLTPQHGDPVSQPGELRQNGADLEAQNDAEEDERESAVETNVEVVEPATLSRNRTRGSRLGRPRKFPRSHSTGHSLVQPGENVDRFTLKLPAGVRKQMVSRALERTMSMVVLPTEGSSKRGYRTGGEGSSKRGYRTGGEGSSRGKYKRVERLDQGADSGGWVLGRNQSFLARATSFLTRVSSSVRSPWVTSGEGSSVQPVFTTSTESGRVTV